MNRQMITRSCALKREIVIALLAGVGVFAFLCLSGAMDALSHPAGWKLGALFAGLMTAVFLGCAHAAKENKVRFATMTLLSVAALAARLVFLETETGDYAFFLSPWVQTFREGGFAMLAQEIGDYNLPYQYILAVIARSSIYDMYLIFSKAISNDTFVNILNTKTYDASYKSADGTVASQVWTNTCLYFTGEAEVPEGYSIVGGKTGTTSSAGYCLVLLSTNKNNEKVISIVYKATDRTGLYKYMNEILTYSSK